VQLLNLPLRVLVHGSLLAVLAAFAGCETKSYMDPSRTGYFETTPTSIPILSRIDVIEQAADSSIEYTQPTPEDLVPNQLEYRLAPGDVMKVSIPQLISSTETDISTRVVDQAGKISLPIIGQVQAAGLTVQEIEKEIEKEEQEQRKAARAEEKKRNKIPREGSEEKKKSRLRGRRRRRRQ
jgi:hypothetical protein